MIFFSGPWAQPHQLIQLNKNGELFLSGPWAHSRQFSQAGTPKRSGNKPKNDPEMVQKVLRNKAFCGGAKCPKPFVFLVFPCIPGARRIPKSEPKCTPARGSFLHLPGAEGDGKFLRFRVPQNAVFSENLLKSIDSIK